MAEGKLGMLFAMATFFFCCSCSSLITPLTPSQALRQAGFTAFADSLQTSNLLSLPPNFTLLAPPDTFLLQSPLSPLSLRYHIASLRLSYHELSALPLHSRIPTLLSGQRIVITSLENNLLSKRLTLDGIPLLSPDLYLDSHVAVHAIDAVLDYFSYGSEDVPLPQDRPPPLPPSLEINSSFLRPQPTLPDSDAASSYIVRAFMVHAVEGCLLSVFVCFLATGSTF